MAYSKDNIIFPRYISIAPVVGRIWAIFNLNDKQEKYPVLAWGVRHACLEGDKTDPEDIDYTEVIGLMMGSGERGCLIPVDTSEYQGEFVEYIQE